MMQPTLKVETYKVADLIPYAHNAKQHPTEQVDQICDSIDQFGFNDPIAIDENNIVIEGHGRLLAAKRLGMTEVPVIRLEHLDDEAKRAYILIHNKLTMNTDFDPDILRKELDKIFDIDMAYFGFDVEEPEELEDADVDEDEVPEDAPSRVAEGDIWKLGDHRLICGDSCSTATITELMDGDEADMLLTDPPYNVSYVGGTADELTIKNDSFATAQEFEDFLTAAMVAASTAMRPGAAFYIWFASSGTREFFNACAKAGLHVRQDLVWIKNSIVLSRQDYQWQTERCLYGWIDGAAHWFAPTRTERNVIDDQLDPAKMSKAQLREALESFLEQYPNTDALREDKPLRNDVHPTMKPVALFARLIRNSSKRGAIVLDTFGGSGTTIVACEQMCRVARCVELDPHYCNVILERWERLTGKQAEFVRNVNDDEAKQSGGDD